MDKTKIYRLTQSTIESFIWTCNKDLIISVNKLDGDTVTVAKEFKKNDISLKIGYDKTLILTGSISDAVRCIMSYFTRYSDNIRVLYIDVDGDGNRVTINFEE